VAFLVLQMLLGYQHYQDASPEQKVALLERGECPPGETLPAYATCLRVYLRVCVKLFFSRAVLEEGGCMLGKFLWLMVVAIGVEVAGDL